MDPKDLTINVGFVDARCKIVLTHKPTGLFEEEEGPADQKEAIHSRLWAKLKERVGNSQQVLAERLEKSIRSTFPSDDEALVMEAYDFGQFSRDMLGPVLTGGVARGLAEPVRVALCNVLDQMHKRLYGPMQEPVAEARTVPEPQPVLSALCMELMMAKMTHQFSFSRDELVNLLGGWDKVSNLAVAPAPEQPSSQVHPDSALPSKVQQ